MKDERSFKKMNIDFAKTIEFLECATFLEHSRRNFADQMITGRAISLKLCIMTLGTPCTNKIDLTSLTVSERVF